MYLFKTLKHKSKDYVLPIKMPKVQVFVYKWRKFNHEAVKKKYIGKEQIIEKIYLTTVKKKVVFVSLYFQH